MCSSLEKLNNPNRIIIEVVVEVKAVTYNIFFINPVARKRKRSIKDHDQKDEQCDKIGRECNKSDCGRPWRSEDLMVEQNATNS